MVVLPIDIRCYYSCWLPEHSLTLFVPNTGLPPLVFRRVLEVLTYLATNHSAVADMLFYFDSSLLYQKPTVCEGKGKEKATHATDTQNLEIPLVVFLKLLNRPQLLQSTSHLALVCSA